MATYKKMDSPEQPLKFSTDTLQKTMIDAINAKKFDNEDNEINEVKEKKGNSVNKKLYKKTKSQTGVLSNSNIKKTKINSVKTQREIKAKNMEMNIANKNEIKNEIKNGGVSETVNESVIQSIKLLMDTLSVDNLKIIQNDIQKMIDNKK